MSHIAKMSVAVTSVPALTAACVKRLGWSLEAAEEYAWFGRWVGDTPLPAGVNVHDLGKCDFKIKIPGCRYEVGVVKQPNGSLTLLWDYWDQSLLKAMGQDGARLAEAYTLEAAIEAMQADGATLLGETVMPDGVVELEFSTL